MREPGNQAASQKRGRRRMLVPAGSTHGPLGGGTEPVSEAEGEAGAAGGHPVPPPLLHLTQTQGIHSLALLTT